MFSQRTEPWLLRIVFLASLALSTAMVFPSAAAERLRIGYTSPGPQHGLLWLGDTAGLFKKIISTWKLSTCPATFRRRR